MVYVWMAMPMGLVRPGDLRSLLRLSCSAHSHTPITYSVSAIDESRRGSLCLQQRVCSSDAPAHRGPKPQQTSLVLYMQHTYQSFFHMKT